MAAAALAACALAACQTLGPPRGGAARIPAEPMELGNWRNASEAATLSAFERTVANRYGAGLAYDAVASDMRRNEFDCAAAPSGGRGAPPTGVCRRTLVNAGCTHTWQVHLFAQAQRLERARALYDRRCSSDGLLGGPS